MKTMQVNVLSYLDAVVHTHPHKVAYYDEIKKITFLELLNNSHSVGTHLFKNLNGEIHAPIMVIVERDIESLVLMFGVVYSGNYYVTIDPKMPVARINQIIQTLNPQLIVGQKKHADLIKSLSFTGSTINYEDAISTDADVAILKKIQYSLIDTDPLYILFTSGSTGVPKGVIISHRSMIDYVDQISDVFHFDANTIFANQASFFFDISITDIYCTLKCASTMHIVPQSYYAYPIKLIQYLNEYKINTISWSTAAFRILANLHSFEKQKPEYLHTILFMGEVMPCKILNYWRKHIPDGLYANLYGPTEITNVCTYYIVDREYLDDEPLPIGIPFLNTDVFLLTDENRLAENDDIGEICVRGSSLALGYYNNPEKTSEVFCQNPLNPYYPELIYRTGDLGRYNKNREIMYVSRKDHLIKYHGYRVELGEIEAAATSHEAVDASCCLYDVAYEEIVLIYQSPNKDDVGILEYLSNKLPKYMLPKRLVHLEKFPMTLNSKIDRVRLKEDYIQNVK